MACVRRRPYSCHGDPCWPRAARHVAEVGEQACAQHERTLGARFAGEGGQMNESDGKCRPDEAEEEGEIACGRDGGDGEEGVRDEPGSRRSKDLVDRVKEPVLGSEVATKHIRRRESGVEVCQRYCGAHEHERRVHQRRRKGANLHAHQIEEEGADELHSAHATRQRSK